MAEVKPEVVMCYQLLDDILSRISVKLIEPKSTQKEVVRCYPLLNAGVPATNHVYDIFNGP
jgi:hypothetical protein